MSDQPSSTTDSASSPKPEEDLRQSWWMCGMNTFAFTICFAAWMMNGVLITFLVQNGLPEQWGLDPWGPREYGLLISIPVLTGAIFRLPLGIATDKWGGRYVYSILLVCSAVPMYLVSICESYAGFVVAGLGFGFCGTSFAIGIAYTSVWFPQRLQGTALGIFGAGNAGAALTGLGAPRLLKWLTDDYENLDGWTTLPKIYAGMLFLTGVLFFLTTKTKLPPGGATKSMRERLAPLKQMRVWRFSLYYFFVFGGFVALAQWLVPYYVNVYGEAANVFGEEGWLIFGGGVLGGAGFLMACNTLPSGVIRALGGWMSDKWGARRVMYWVFGTCLVCCVLMAFPQMYILTPGAGVKARYAGIVASITETETEIKVVVHSKKLNSDTPYTLTKKQGELISEKDKAESFVFFPKSMSWHELAVKEGDKIKPKALVGRSVTGIFFQANIWIFTILSLILGAVMGIGKAGVYKHIPTYFPNDVGVVGGIVGVIGGLGGFVCPNVFAYLLDATGLWTTCWMFFFGLIALCMFWMHRAIRTMTIEHSPEIAHEIETPPPAAS